MDALETTRFLHQRIPVTRAMGFEVTQIVPGRVAIRAPLALNFNPHETVFGGTLTTLGLVSGWTLLHVAMQESGVQGKLFGQRSESTFVAPGTGDCTSVAECAADELAAFLDTCRKRRRARITISSITRCADVEVARHQNVFVAMTEDRAFR